jgi:hypothetical protein
MPAFVSVFLSCLLALGAFAGVSCPSYCVQFQASPANREACVLGCQLGAVIPVADVIPAAETACPCNASAPCFVGCSRALRCAKCFDGYCEVAEDANGFICSFPRQALAAATPSGAFVGYV